ncbi:hypothetical protein ANCCAN_15664 [Ancylostoma caninum]|uniref:Uncharacterized protein n=1 Tax=Ancylostoma caninum TaxID=29170 RepID=A0A368G1V4_ANCCA|nr:hypothetical protein ANCCAN_15664 [Ancylostoma caninum]
MSNIQVEGRLAARPHSFIEDMKSVGGGIISLKERLAALNKSAENWQTRVKKDEVVLKRSSSAVTARLPPRPRLGKENEAETVKPVAAAAAPMSKQSLILNLDKGLDSFFPRTTVLHDSNAKDGELDLNSIEQTDILDTPKRPRLKKHGQKRRLMTDRLATLDTGTVKIEEVSEDGVSNKNGKM